MTGKDIYFLVIFFYFRAFKQNRNVKSLVEIFTKQLEEALEIGNKANLTPNTSDIKNVVITGLGGSGIGGKIVSQLVANQIKVPVIINNDYTLPNFVNEHTLVIASSFSGNTEETLAATKIALEKNATVACITSGGKLLEIAKQKGLNYIVLPQGESPRAMLTYSLTQQFFILNHYKLIDNNFIANIKSGIDLLNSELTNIKSQAQTIAESIHNKTAIIYAESQFEGVAIRLRQQLNENSKVLCWHHVIPEMNHNELVGWSGGDDRFAVINFHTDFDHPRSSKRMDIIKEVITQKTSDYIDIYAKGENIIEQALYLILIGDWISVYLADIRGVDPIEVNVISYLKGELAKF